MVSWNIRRHEIIPIEFRAEGLQRICDLIPNNGLHTTASIDIPKYEYIELTLTDIGLGIPS